MAASSVAVWRACPPARPQAETGRPFHLRDHRIERAVLMMRRAEIAQTVCGSAVIRSDQRLGETGLANARLGGNQHHPPFAGLRLPPAAEQQIQFLVAADQRRTPERSASNRPSARFSATPPCRHRLRQTFEFDEAEIPALEQAADLPARGPQSRLYQARRGLAGVPRGSAFRRRPFAAANAGADRLANDHKSRRDANADL